MVAKWMTGEAETKYYPYRRLVSSLTSILNSGYTKGHIAPASNHHDFVSHIYRERNAHADALTKSAAEGQLVSFTLEPNDHRHVTDKFMRLQTDGSADTKNSRFSIGGALWLSEKRPGPALFTHDWRHALDFALQVEAQSAMETELLALSCGIAYMFCYIYPHTLHVSPSDFTSIDSIIRIMEDIQRRMAVVEIP